MLKTEPDLEHVRVNGVELAYLQRGTPKPGEPTLLFVHATGCHARVWDRIIESFGGYHLLALNQRGHGRSEKRVIEHWRVFGEDLAAFVAALGLEKLIGIGHSMGGHALVDAAAKCGAFARLLLLCPPEIEASVYVTARTNGGVHDSARALNIPVTIMRAQLPPTERSEMDFASSPTWPELVGEFKRGRDLHYPACSQFIPLQMPDEVIRVLQEEIDAWHAGR